MTARLLPEGFTESIWPSLDPAARALLVEEFLVLNAAVQPTGSIDLESPREPIFTDTRDGKFVSLVGEKFTIPEPLTVTVSPGGFLPTNRLLENALFAAALVLGVIIVARI